MNGELSDFDEKVRFEELSKILKNAEFPKSEVEAVNTHIHTFYSFNIDGLSPAEVLYKSKMHGLEVAGTVDFDVLDAMEEVFEVGDMLKLRTIASLETRAYVEDYKEREINSPGECGILYSMGVGFARLPNEGTEEYKTLQSMRKGARDRNIALIGRLQSTLEPLVLDYSKDVESLTPAGNATERHIVEALEVKSRATFKGEDLANYWSVRLGVSVSDAEKLLEDSNALRNTIRSKLMKRGSVGYVAPDSTTFPPLADVMDMVKKSKAIPCWAWLDGFSDGEKDADELVDYMVSAGIRSIAIIPERNWNFSDTELKAKKIAALKDIVEAGKKKDMLFVVGTEMNGFGQPFVDDFSAAELAPFIGDFLAGAYAVYGHTLLERAVERGLMSSWAEEMFGTDYLKANEFYADLGRASKDPAADIKKLQGLGGFSDLKSIVDVVKL